MMSGARNRALTTMQHEVLTASRHVSQPSLVVACRPIILSKDEMTPELTRSGSSFASLPVEPKPQGRLNQTTGHCTICKR